MPWPKHAIHKHTTTVFAFAVVELVCLHRTCRLAPLAFMQCKPVRFCINTEADDNINKPMYNLLSSHRLFPISPRSPPPQPSTRKLCIGIHQIHVRRIVFCKLTVLTLLFMCTKKGLCNIMYTYPLSMVIFEFAALCSSHPKVCTKHFEFVEV